MNNQEKPQANAVTTICSTATDWWTLRASAYVLAIVGGGWWLLQRELAAAQAAFDAGDRSALAWTGFWPFIFPMFFGFAAAAVIPLAAIIELVLWIKRRSNR